MALKQLGLDKRKYFICDICKNKITKQNIGGFIPGRKVICEQINCKITARSLDLIK